MLQSLLKFLAGGAAEQVGEYFKERQQLKHKLQVTKLEGKIQVQQAKANAAAERQKHYANWEMAQIANSGYKDEVVLAVVLSPYIGSYIPVVQDYVVQGHKYLAQMPYWAVGLTVTIMLAIYGIRHRNATKINAPGLRGQDVGKSKEEG